MPSDLQLAQDSDASRPMSDSNNNRVTNVDDPAAPNIGGGIPQGVDPNSISGLGGTPSTPPPPPKPPIHTRIAEGIMHALGGSDGKPGDWAKATIAGALAGLGGAAAAPVKRGAPISGGIGLGAAAATQQRQQQQQQQVENSQKQQQIDLQKQREQREASNQSAELDLRKAENARAQAQSVRDAATFEKNLTVMDQHIAANNFESMKQNAEYLEGQSAKWDALNKIGAKPLEINGAKSPEFEHLGEAEDFAAKNSDAVINGYMSHIVRNPTSGKWSIMEIPNDGPKWRDLTDAKGKTIKVLADSQAYLAMQEQVAKTKHFLNTAGRSSLELKEELEGYKEQGSVKGARKELTKVGGDYAKLSPGSKEALLHDANDRFSKAQAGLEKELQKPEELRDKDTVDTLTSLRNEYAKEVRSLTPHPFPGQDKPKTAPELPDEKRSAITLRLKNFSPEEQLQFIQSTKMLSDADKQKLIEELGLKQQAPAAPAAQPQEAQPEAPQG